MIMRTLANLLLPTATLLSIVALVIGLMACPMQSLALQHAFVYVSVATLIVGVAALFRNRETRRIRYELGIVPLVILWGVHLWCRYEDSRIRDSNSVTQTINNAKNVGLAFEGHEEFLKQLPRDVRDKQGVALLSWRVSICPFIDHGPLFEQFNIGQSWDSPHNLPLLKKMPAPYYNWWSLESQDTNTAWQTFVGPGTAFESGRALSLARDFPDGRGNTVLFVEAQKDVPWSKPVDLAFGPGIPLPELGRPYPRKGDWPFCCPVKTPPRYMVCMGDATVRMFPADLPEAQLRALIVRNDGFAVVVPD